MCLVGASNELPESEELDALYDRFLLRKKVRQVSPAGLTALLSNLDDEAMHESLEERSTGESGKKGAAGGKKKKGDAESLLADSDFVNVKYVRCAVVLSMHRVLSL